MVRSRGLVVEGLEESEDEVEAEAEAEPESGVGDGNVEVGKNQNSRETLYLRLECGNPGPSESNTIGSIEFDPSKAIHIQRT